MSLGVALLAAAGCGRRPLPAAPPVARVALFPIDNASAGSAPTRDVAVRLEVALRGKGIDVVTGDIVEGFLARHRIRYTGGVDEATAHAAKEELEVDGVLIASVELYRRTGATQYGMSMRLVSSGEDPRILWIDGTARAGDESPGLFGLGLVGSVRELEGNAIARLADSLATFLQGKGPRAVPCPADGRFRPRILYRSGLSRPGKRISVAVLPFVNESNQPNAGDVVALAFVRTLVATGWLDVRDPGIVRSELLRHRVVMEGGVSHEAARIALGAMDVDVVVSGYVRSYSDTEPKVEFTVVALDTWNNRVVWRSSSFNRGMDGVFFFDVGRVPTANALACRMVRNVVDDMAGYWEKRRVPEYHWRSPRRPDPDARF